MGPSKPNNPKNPNRFQRQADYDGPVWIYGHHAVSELVRNPQRTWTRLIATRNAARILPASLAPELLEPRDFDQIFPDEVVHQGLAALANPLPERRVAEILESAAGRPLVFLDQVTDPHNVGAILRSAAAFGAAALITTRRHAPPVTGVLAKAASGALEHVPFVKVGNLADALLEAKEAGYELLGLDEEGSPLHEASFDAPAAVVLGAEGPGLRERTTATCDRLLRIAAEGPIGALNVSNAAAVALYAVTRARSALKVRDAK